MNRDKLRILMLQKTEDDYKRFTTYQFSMEVYGTFMTLTGDGK